MKTTAQINPESSSVAVAAAGVEALLKESDRLLALADKATPGPWERDDYNIAHGIERKKGQTSALWIAEVDVLNRNDCLDDGTSEAADADAAFIAAAHELAANNRSLAAALRAASARERVAKEALEAARGYPLLQRVDDPMPHQPLERHESAPTIRKKLDAALAAMEPKP